MNKLLVAATAILFSLGCHEKCKIFFLKSISSPQSLFLADLCASEPYLLFLNAVLSACNTISFISVPESSGFAPSPPAILLLELLLLPTMPVLRPLLLRLWLLPLLLESLFCMLLWIFLLLLLLGALCSSKVLTSHYHYHQKLLH